MRPFTDYPFTPVRHAVSLPPLVDGRDRQRHRVVIVGGGPTGLCVALGLARQGVASVVLEADDGVCAGSRAICISRRSLEIVSRLGAGAAFLAKGLPWTGGRSFHRDREVLHFEMPQDDSQRFPPMVNLAQFHIEQCLLDAVETLSELIEVRWQQRVRAVAQDEHGAVLAVATPAGDYKLAADWVVACDGARSTLRELLGLRLEGTQYEGRYVIVDIAMKSERPTERLAWFDPPSNPGSTLLMHRQPDDIWRIDYQLRDDEDGAEALRMENIEPRIERHLRMLGETADWAPIWSSLYKANALTLREYWHGRVLFAGDAAHLMPIFGVRGANSSIDDADNLAWKLAWVARGIADPALLASYSAERVSAAHENLAAATKSTAFMAPPSPAYELMRDAVLELSANEPFFRQLINPRQTSAIAYRESPLNVTTEDEAMAGPAPGELMFDVPVQVVTPDGLRHTHLGALQGPGLTLVYLQDETITPLATLQGMPVPVDLVAIGDHAVPVGTKRVLDACGAVRARYGTEPGNAWLLRPDGHVLARWARLNPDTIAGTIRQLLRGGAP